jgi:hypothetical protein
MTNKKIGYVTQLNKSILSELIDRYHSHPERSKLRWRYNAPWQGTEDIVTPIISNFLGTENWKISGGNYFETFSPYRIHTDTLKESHNILQTFVFPLAYEYEENAQLGKNGFYVLEQEWFKESTMFVKGTSDRDLDDGNRYNTQTRDYKDIVNLKEGYDETLVEDCNHLPRENFEGMTVWKKFVWKPGTVISFPRSHLHLSNNFKKYGIKSKLGLSIFTSTLD